MGRVNTGRPVEHSLLEKGWVIANHILVSFHVAFISSVLSVPVSAAGREVLRFMFTSGETLISALFTYISWHSAIAVHEMGHYVKAVRLDALNARILPEAKVAMNRPPAGRILWYLRMFMLIPYGKFTGVVRSGLNYYPDAPFNLAVAAAGPRSSRNLSVIFLPAAIILISLGLIFEVEALIYPGRLCLGLGLVGLLDFCMADSGKYREFKEREARALTRAAEVTARAAAGWIEEVGRVKERIITTRMQQATGPDGGAIRAPWQYRNSGMGGRHTSVEYPESNISMQETMFIPLSPADYADAQEMTVSLQNRLKEIIENAEGGRVMGIGLEGGLAPYVTKDDGDIVPEQRLWRMAKQAIIDCGYVPGVDVALALDPAANELEIAYREEFDQPGAIGMYLFWRSEDKVIMSSDEVFELYRKTLAEDDVPIVSIEDGFSEEDDAGWALIMKELGDEIFVIGDDSVTTKDSSVEYAADHNLNNTMLCKANQIGTLSETLLAILIAFGKGLEIVVSHRSKSPNDDMEAQIALSAFTMGLKAGGGANTERLVKYGSIMKVMAEATQERESEAAPAATAEKTGIPAEKLIDEMVITRVLAWEEATNAGIPTVGVRVSCGLAGDDRFSQLFTFTGSTPLGTSAGTGEAIHLVDSVIYRDQIPGGEHLELFTRQADGSFRFKEEVTRTSIDSYNDPALSELYRRAQRYDGGGCLQAVDNVYNILAPAFEGKRVKDLTDITVVDRALLALERDQAVLRGQITEDASETDQIDIMQRKGNIGMNAILSLSLALSRLVAHMQGKQLWQLLREDLVETMAKTISANRSGEERSWEEIRDGLTFDELREELQKVNADKPEGVALYELLREALAIYRIDA